MKNVKKIFALLIAMVMVFAMSTSVFAASITITSTAPTGSTADNTSYVAYEIFKADILSTGTIDAETGELAEGQTAGKVAYYIPTTDAGNTLKNAIAAATSIFTFTQSADGERWIVELADENTTAADIADALNVDAIKNAALSKAEFAQTTPGGTATSGNVDPGYYLITSSLGTELVVQTLADVTINTKNEYITDDKVAETASLTIGENATYYIKVYLPASIDTTEPVIVHDTLAEQLSFNTDSVQAVILNENPGSTAAEYAEAGSYAALPDAFVVSTTTPDDCTFHITLNTNGYAGKYIVFKYTAQLLATADADGDGYVNNEFTEYSDYKTVPSNPVVKTYDFDISKTDGEKALTGAEFKLYGAWDETNNKASGNAIEFFAVTGGYKKADASDGTTVDGAKVTTLEAGNINVAGFGAGTYYLVETKAPTGFNLLSDPIIITITDDGTISATLSGESLGSFTLDQTAEFEVINNSGTQLPSTGGIGTTIFYVVGALLVVGAGVVLVTRRKVDADK